MNTPDAIAFSRFFGSMMEIVTLSVAIMILIYLYGYAYERRAKNRQYLIWVIGLAVFLYGLYTNILALKKVAAAQEAEVIALNRQIDANEKATESIKRESDATKREIAVNKEAIRAVENQKVLMENLGLPINAIPAGHTFTPIAFLIVGNRTLIYDEDGKVYALDLIKLSSDLSPETLTVGPDISYIVIEKDGQLYLTRLKKSNPPGRGRDRANALVVGAFLFYIGKAYVAST